MHNLISIIEKEELFNFVDDEYFTIPSFLRVFGLCLFVNIFMVEESEIAA
jgi:hypothetical protein